MADLYGDWTDWLLCLGIAVLLGARWSMHNPDGHSPRWWKRHPEHKMSPRTGPKGESNIPVKTFPAKEIVLVLIVPLVGVVLTVVGLERVFPLYINLFVCIGALIAIAIGVWEGATVGGWKLGRRAIMVVVVSVVCVCLFFFPIKKQYLSEYDMNLSFRDAPSLDSWWTRIKINWNFVRARDYLKSLNVSVVDLPPVDIGVFNDPIQSTPPGKPGYRGSINLTNDALGDPKRQTASYFFYEISQIVWPDMSKVPQWRRPLVQYFFDLSDYFNSSFWDEATPTMKPKSGWGARLWAVRERFGKQFTDQAVAYTLRSLGDSPDEGQSDQLDVYLCRHFKIGEAVVDHDAGKWKEIVSVLGQEHSGLDRACNQPAAVAPTAPQAFDPHEQQLRDEVFDRLLVEPRPVPTWASTDIDISIVNGAHTSIDKHLITCVLYDFVTAKGVASFGGWDESQITMAKGLLGGNRGETATCNFAITGQGPLTCADMGISITFWIGGDGKPQPKKDFRFHFDRRKELAWAPHALDDKRGYCTEH